MRKCSVVFILVVALVFGSLPVAFAAGYYDADVDDAPVEFVEYFAAEPLEFLVYGEDDAVTPMDVQTVNLATVLPGAPGEGWSFATDVLSIHDGANIIVTTGGVETERRIVVAWGATATITLFDARIGTNQDPLGLGGGTNLTLYLEGDNYLTSATMPGLSAPAAPGLYSAVTIKGSGSLTAIGGGNSPGIGGIEDVALAAGTITIIGDTNVTAIGSGTGAGIGGAGGAGGAGAGGRGGEGGRITIGGNATVTATGGYFGVGIGGGSGDRGGAGGMGGTITIGGDATVIATGGNNAAGIGGGAACGRGIIGGAGGAGGTISIYGNANVTAIGDGNSAGIGGGAGGRFGIGGAGGSGGNITIGGTATVTAMASSTGAAVGGAGGGTGSGATNDGAPGASGIIRFEDYATVNAHRGTYNGAAIGPGVNGVGQVGATTEPIYWGANTNVTMLDPLIHCDECDSRPCRCCPVSGEYPCACPDCEYCNDEGCEECDPTPPPVYTIPEITIYNAPNGTQGDVYSFQFAATGNPAPVWSYTALPPGLSLSGDGLLSGTPSEAGPFTITVTATNTEGYDYREIAIEISPPQDLPDAVLSVSTTNALPGQTATVEIGMSNNPGFAALPLQIHIPSGAALVMYDTPEPLRAGFTGPQNTERNVRIPDGLDGYVYFNWLSATNRTANGVLLTLTLEIAPDVDPGNLPITVAFAGRYGPATPTDDFGATLDIAIINGYVQVTPARVLGSVSGSGPLSYFDAILIARHLAGHEDLHLLPGVTDFDISAGIVTPGSRALGHVRLVDAIMIMRYLAGHPIVLGYYPVPQS